jgi:hypothetical protein
MAIVISDQLTIGLKSELGGLLIVCWERCASTTRCLSVTSFAEIQRRKG